MKEANRLEELKDGLLYVKLQKKLPASMLASYHRWIFEKCKRESVEVLREWAIQESEFHTRALETIQGLNSGNLENRPIRGTRRTFFGRSNFRSETGVEPRGKKPCKVCNKPHGVWACGEFKQLDTPKRWEYAKKFRLCFRCLGEDHLGQHCTRTRVCGQNGCKEVHHRLLHKDSLLPSNDTKANKNEEGNKCEKMKRLPLEKELNLLTLSLLLRGSKSKMNKELGNLTQQ